MVLNLELPNSDTYCQNQLLYLKESVGFTKYKWQYRIGVSGSWINFDPGGVGNNKTFDISNIYGSLSSKLLKNIYFRYEVGNCGFTATSPQAGPYYFTPTQAEVSEVIKGDLTCFGETLEEITILTNRQPISGESFRYDVRRKDSDGSYLKVINSANETITNSAIIGEGGAGLISGDYDVLITSSLYPEGSNIPLGCAAVDRKTFSILGPTQPITEAEAGPSQNVCSATATLTGNAIAADETVQWSLVSGAGTIANSASTTATVSGFEPGANVFRYKITQAYGCTDSSQVTIIGEYPPIANAGTNQIVCQPTAALAANSLPQGQTGLWTIVSGGGSFQGSTTNNTIQAIDLEEGVNTFKWTVNKAGCTEAESDITITYKNITVANAGEGRLVCGKSSVLAANAVKSGETGTWSVVSGAGTFNDQNNPTAVVSGLNVGTNTLKWTITDNSDTCTSTEGTVTFTVSDLSITENSALRVNPSCFGEQDGSITVSAAGGSPFASGLDYKFTLNGEEQFADLDVPVTFSGLGAGVYTVTTTDGANCIQNTAIIMLSTPNQILISDTKTPISCFGESDGAINLSTANGVGALSYQWSKIGSGNFATTKDVANLSEGVYQVIVTDANGCSNNKEVVITQPFELSANGNLSNYDGFNISCNGSSDGTIDLEVFDGTSPFSYAWSNGSTDENQQNLTAGTYSVVVTDANSCVTSQTFILQEPQPLIVNQTAINPISCYGQADGIAIINTSGGSPSQLYSLDGTNYQASNIFRGLDAGSYDAYIKVSENCEQITSFSIDEPPILSAIISDQSNATCEEPTGGATVFAEGGTGNLSYIWQNSLGEQVGSGAAITALPGGVYSALVTDESGCSVIKFVNINSEDGAEISTNNIGATTCFNSEDGSATIDVSGNSPFEIYWANGENGSSATRLKAGLNTVIIIDSEGCVVVETVNIPSPDVITYEVAKVRPSCNDSQNGALQVVASGGAGDYAYSWSNGATGNNLSDIGEGRYTLTISDQNGCQLTDEVFLYAPDPIGYAIISNIPPSCGETNDASITIKGTGGTPPYTYLWSSNIEGPVLKNVSAGDYEVVITDSRGCNSTEILTVETTAPLEINFEPEVSICTGSLYLASYDNNDAVSYNWKYNGQVISTEKQLYVNEAGVYSLTVSNASGCQTEESFTLSFSDDLLSADYVMATEAYVGDTVMIIDISWPIPENISWTYPEQATMLEENKDYLSVVFEESGEYKIGMDIALGQCTSYREQMLTILPLSSKSDQQAAIISRKQSMIKSFTVFPNPTEGDFNIAVKLREQSDVNISMVDLKGNAIVLASTLSGSDSYEVAVSRKALQSGLYIIKLTAGNKTTYKRIAVK